MVSIELPRKTLERKISGQAIMLLAAFGLGQGLSLARNALLGHWLSKGDFGVAATITLVLQLAEVLSDVGVDRHVVQSEDGELSSVQGCAHTILVARGLLTSVLIFLLAHPITGFFRIPEAAWAFEMAALSPLLRGFLHLDVRRFQRKYDNRAFVLLEVVPQAAALALMPPALHWLQGYAAVAAAFVVQALITMLLSWHLAARPYRLSFETGTLVRMLSFGWPIWLSAFPLVAVYQGERVIVGRLLGIEALAAFTVVFMATMVPGLAAAKISNSLMLPLMSATRQQAGRFSRRVRSLSEATTLAASIYAALFIVCGGQLIPIAFGPSYHGLGALASCLGVMWAVRMLQVVPGMALMSLGFTRPLLIAGCVRALALPLALLLAMHGAGLPAVAATGIAGELGSLLYVSIAANAVVEGIGLAIVRRSLFLVPACAVSFWLSHALPGHASIAVTVATFTGLSSALAMAAFAVMPGLRRYVDLRRRINAGLGHPVAAR